MEVEVRIAGATSRRALAVVEAARLTVVVSLTAAGYHLGGVAAGLAGWDPDSHRLTSSVLGALVGYVAGGVTGRAFVSGVDAAERRLRRVDAVVLVAAALGAALAALIAFLVAWPVVVLPGRSVTVPLALGAVLAAGYVGGHVGAARGGDLLRFVGARGRIEVASPSRGGGTKLVDTSALIDGRIVDVARCGFLDGTLVVPRFVLAELQGVADAEDPRRRRAGRRGLDVLRALQDDTSVEISDDDPSDVADVDAKLCALARSRRAALVTVDANLARVAEISGVRVLNLHVLADALRPPVTPGDVIGVAVTRPGREDGQGVGYLPDGTMVVVERAADRVGEHVVAEVTSLLQNRNGRMVFAALDPGDEG